MKQLAVICPGIGYHKDKPLLYYAAKLAQTRGYDLMQIVYHEMPENICGNQEMMQNAAALACQQTEAQLQTVDWSAYDKTLLIGKSIGTIAAARYAAVHSLPAKQIWYTPLNATFLSPPASAGTCIAFLGTADPWSDRMQMEQSAAKQNIPLYLYPDCNHSLECDNVFRNLGYLREIMQITSDFIND